ncbi:MAG TPA: hypothetical protein VJQ44_11015 [Gemmatimonadales bacterium]|nr:hypothetical protein [Gemmatimonadales bacterium]
MHAHDHSTLREGVVTGLLGAIAVAVWYFLIDTAAGQPFHTPNVLGKIIFRGDLTPGVQHVVPGVVAGFTALHFVVYILVGALLALLTHSAIRDTSLRMGVWMGLVCAFCLLAGLTYMLAVATGERLPLWTVLGGSFLGVALMGWYLLGGHPEVRNTGRALGDEVEAPPHPRGRAI